MKGFIRFVDTDDKADTKEVTTAKYNTSGYNCSVLHCDFSYFSFLLHNTKENNILLKMQKKLLYESGRLLLHFGHAENVHFAISEKSFAKKRKKTPCDHNGVIFF